MHVPRKLNKLYDQAPALCAASSDRYSGQGAGKARVDGRRVISGIIQVLKIQVLKSGRRWVDAPPEYRSQRPWRPDHSPTTAKTPSALRNTDFSFGREPSKVAKERHAVAFSDASAAFAALRALADQLANSLPCHDTPGQVSKKLADLFSMRTCSNILILSDSLSIT